MVKLQDVPMSACLGISTTLLENLFGRINPLHMHLRGTNVLIVYSKFLFSSIMFLVKISWINEQINVEHYLCST